MSKPHSALVFTRHWLSTSNFLAPWRWEFQPSIPDSRRSRNMRRRIVAIVVSHLRDPASGSDEDNVSMVCVLNTSASILAFINRDGIAASVASNDWPVLAKCRAARATMDFCKAKSSMLNDSKFRNGFLSLSNRIYKLHIRLLSVPNFSILRKLSFVPISIKPYNNRYSTLISDPNYVCGDPALQRKEYGGFVAASLK